MEIAKPLFVFTMFRHGSRSPVYIRNQVDLLGYTWQEQEGTLTVNGEKQHEALGSTLKLKYGHLILDKIRIFSTDFSRTKNSLKAQLKTLIANESQEKTIFEATTVTPLFDTYWEVYQNQKIKELFGGKPTDEFKQFIEEFKRNSAQHYVNWLPEDFDRESPEVIELASNNLFCLVAEKRNMSKFDDVPERVRESEDFWLKYFSQYFCTGNEKVQDLSNTAIFKLVLESFDSISKSGVQYVTFSCHDLSLLVMMLSLRRLFGSKVIYPSFASCLAFEFYESGGVRVIFNENELLSVDFNEFKETVEATFCTYEEVVGLQAI